MLQHLNIVGSQALSSECVTSVIVALKDSLLEFRLFGEGISDVCFSHLSLVKNLQILYIQFTDLLSSQGLAAISDLTNLQSLHIEENSSSEIRRTDLLAAFSKPSWSSLQRLGSLILL